MLSESHSVVAGRWPDDTKSENLSLEAEEVQLAPNEVPVFKTCIRDGRVSLEEEDIKFHYPDWKVPEYIVKDIGSEYCYTDYGELCVISDEKGKLRFQVSGEKERQSRPVIPWLFDF